MAFLCLTILHGFLFQALIQTSPLSDKSSLSQIRPVRKPARSFRSPPGCLTAQPHLHLQCPKSSVQISADSSPEDPLPPKQRSLSPPYVGDRQQMYDRESFSLRHSSVTHLEPAVAWEDSDTTRVRQLPSAVPNCAVSQSSQLLAQAFLTNLLLVPTLTTSSIFLHRAMLYLKS